ncbi:MAG: TIGR01777 family oxidoreductase [Candidatus Acidiferrales bacterium]
MRILISGSSGLIGSAISVALTREGHTVGRLVRPTSSAHSTSAQVGDVRWDPVAGAFDAAAAEGTDAVVHLAGASIAGGRWTAARKRLLRTSRIEATRHLVESLGALTRPPRIFLCASAIGYFGDRGDESLDEQSAPGTNFLAKLTQDWEREQAAAARFGARVVSMRFGIVLAGSGGALPRMAMPFKFGAGGRLGSGRQWMSWIALRDVVGIAKFALANAALAGPVDAVAPEPMRNADFTRALAEVLHRPAIFPAPAFALRLALGEMADALLLSSQRVFPRRLQESRYGFEQTDLRAALREALGR